MTRTVRPFRTDEADLLAAIRMEALEDSPAAFAERAEAARAMGGEDFRAALATGAVWGVFEDGMCVGMAGFDRHVGANVEHKATIWGVYVRPAARGSGAARALFDGLIAHARAVGVEVLQLGVGDFNARALAFYRRLGFEPFGLELRALKLPDRYIDEVQMALRL